MAIEHAYKTYKEEPQVTRKPYIVYSSEEDADMIGTEPGSVSYSDLDSGVKDLINSKADKDGYCPDLIAGASDSVRTSPIESMFIERALPATVGDGLATIECVKGNTVVWNQLVQTTDSTITPTSGHKYLTRISGTASVITSDGAAISVTGATDNVIDLTLMFGAGNEPATVAEFEALYPNSYYAYDAGSLKPVKMLGVETVGFNQWDEEWESGDLDGINGQPTPSSSYIRSKNYCECMPGTTYFCNLGSNPKLYVFWYDATQTHISHQNKTSNGTVTSPANAAFFKLTINNTSYTDNICINVSNATLNGTYEPYTHDQREIPVSTYFSTGMKSAGTAHDALYSDHYDTVIGSVDLGTLEWVIGAAAPEGSYRLDSSGISTVVKKPSLNNVIANIRCTKYASISGENVYLGNTGISINATTGNIGIYDPNYNDGSAATIAAFKAAMSGVILYYELATPTTTAINPPLNMSYRVESGGTEAIMLDSTQAAPQSAPVITDTRYPANLETGFISIESFHNFYEALGATIDYTITATWDADTGAYDYTFDSGYVAQDFNLSPLDLSDIDIPRIDDIQPIDIEPQPVEATEEVEDIEEA